jgi:hypothetical protein
VNTGNWLAVVTLLIGWSLNELHHWFWSSREAREPFGRALTDLLEIRHELRGLGAILAEFKRRVSISESDERVARTLLESIVPQVEGLEARFNEAVTSIASVDPVLAFRLRRKDQFRTLLGKARALAKLSADGKDLPLWLEDRLTAAFMEGLEELIIDVARAHGLRTWWRVRKRIAQGDELPKEIDELFSSVSPADKQPSAPEAATK